MQPEAPVVQLIGPGGAGKTTIGRVLAEWLGWSFVDLDAQFMAREGDVARCIADHGYLGYARRNVARYTEEMNACTTPAVFALSSGFMTYPPLPGTPYAAIRGAIEEGPLTALLLPAFDVETCVAITVQRQLARPYLRGDRAIEESRIRDRFPMFMALRCARFESQERPEQVAANIEKFVSRQSGLERRKRQTP